ncbi:MAG: prepilin-type N-terminal cleavage/methylation domain-containing protein [Desulfobacteraceae bacterium]|nr:prepilin-type N-terminal cleavage/methylation domain-containing protein [Desulfobacteraceae bacterium]
MRDEKLNRNSFFSRKNKMEESSGFTLLELMVVLAVISVLAGTAVIAASSIDGKHDVQFAADELYGNLQEARMLAIRNGKSCTVNFYLTENAYALTVTGESERQRVDLTNSHRTPVDIVSVSENPIIFTPQGYAEDSSDIVLSGDGKDGLTSEYRVRTSIAGATSITRMDPN